MYILFPLLILISQYISKDETFIMANWHFTGYWNLPLRYLQAIEICFDVIFSSNLCKMVSAECYCKPSTPD
jgi:hypothetical protein